MGSCDVLIVGGGPAGSTLAWRLKDGGLDVLVLDKNEFPRDKVCAGWITPAVVKSLRVDMEEYRQNRVLQPISRFRTGLIGGTEIVTEYESTVSYGIRRCEFDHYLLERSGARLRLGEPLKSIERESGHWVVNGEFKTPLVVGAGGHFCPVARFIGARSDETRPVVVAQETEFEMDPRQRSECMIMPETPELYFCEDLKGYGWCFRKGDFLNIGLGREDKHKLSEHVEAFYTLLKQRGKIPSDTPANFRGHAYLLYKNGLRKVFDDGVLLIGDAVGLAYPQSGEGIRPAVESAMMAADVIIGAKGEYNGAGLQRYSELLTRRFGKVRSGSRLFGMLPSGLKGSMAKMLMGSRSFSRHILLDRWFLHTRQSQLNA